MRVRKLITCCALGLCFLNGFGQNENDDYAIEGEAELISKKYKETIAKMAIYIAHLKSENLAINSAKSYVYSAEAVALSVRNPTWNNIKKGIVKELLPNYTKQEVAIPEILDKELMRDINQYVKYAETFLEYGMLMTSFEQEILTAVNPEQNIDGTGTANFEEVEGMASELDTYGGLTIPVYQQLITDTYQEIIDYEPTGDAEMDDAAIKAIIASNFADEQQQENVLGFIAEMDALELSEDKSERDANQELIQGMFEDYFDMLEEQEREAAELAAALELEEEAAENPDVVGWNNEIDDLMASMQVGNRSVSARYGEAGAGMFNDYKQKKKQGMETAITQLTNVIKVWNEAQKLEYLQKAEELMQIGQELLENGIDVEGQIDRIQDFYGQIKQLWNVIRASKK